jgi:hypothetical protein
MKKPLFILALIILSFMGSIKAQRGMLDNTIGVRLGLGSGVSFQHFFSDYGAMELIAHQRYGGVALTGLYEMHNQMFDVKGLKWYWGAGAHVGVYSLSSKVHEGTGGGDLLAAGVDAITGLEYFFRGLPLQISADWKPAFNLVGTRYVEWSAGAISLRYRF